MKNPRVAAVVLVAMGAAVLPLAGQQPPAPSTPPAAQRGALPPGAVGPKEGGRGDQPLPEMKPVVWVPGKTRVLMVGGGSSHPYNTEYNPLDTAILQTAGFSVNYTEDRDQAAAELKGADVALLSVNRRYFDAPEYRKALMDFAAAGKGIVLLHAGVWKMWPEWPEFYQQIAGGWALSHDRLGPFTVTVTNPTHPVMTGVPATFTVEDELYHENAEAASTAAGTSPIEVLAETQPSAKYMTTHPSVWVTKHPKARIVGIALGHDHRVHDLPAFKTLLANAVKWVAKK
jgi:type 1 glutamine amidotransferase